MANGALLEWNGYEYARVNDGGYVTATGDLESLKVSKKPGKLMFRAHYVTDWIEVTDGNET